MPIALVPVFKGKRGNPVLLSRALEERVHPLEGDSGARFLLRELPSVVEWSASDDAVLLDIDTRGQLERLRGGTEQQSGRSPKPSRLHQRQPSMACSRATGQDRCPAAGSSDQFDGKVADPRPQAAAVILWTAPHKNRPIGNRLCSGCFRMADAAQVKGPRRCNLERLWLERNRGV